MAKRDEQRMEQANNLSPAALALKPNGALSGRVLTQAFVAREPWALAALYDEYATVLYSLALSVINDEGAAQEVVQEVFLAAWQNRDWACGHDSDLGAALILLCRNRAIAARRAQMHLHTRAQTLDVIANVLARQGENGMSPPASDGGRLRQWFATLLPEQKAVVEMTYLHGMTPVEIAANLHLPEAQVRAFVRQSLSQMLDILGQEEAREPQPV